MHRRTSIALFSIAVALLSGCDEATKRAPSMFYPCQGSPFAEGFVIPQKQQSALIETSMQKLIESKNVKNMNEFNNYCQFIKLDRQSYCVMYLLKDHSPGGDITSCHKNEDSGIISVEFGE